MKDQKKFQKLIKSILKDFIIYSVVSTVLFIISALVRNYSIPVTVNSSYMEDIAAGGTGIATVSIGSTFANITYYISIITVIIFFGIFITKTIVHIKKFIKDKDISE